jgi:predicted lysophospholipase L1 biosynthesis ABC-type transport system permease subunit
VIDDVHEANVEGKPGWQVYFSATQEGPADAELVVRTKLPPEALAVSVMTKLRQLNPNQPAAEFRKIQTIVDHAVSPRRFFVLLVVSFAVFGVILAALGIYGVISYSVTQRTQEIGIRMALGATVRRVQLGVIGKTIRLALIGIVAGTAASVVVAKGIAALLFGTAPTDPATFAGVILLLAAVALLAGYLPARRASRIDPMVAGTLCQMVNLKAGTASIFFVPWEQTILHVRTSIISECAHDNPATGSDLHLPAAFKVARICASSHTLHRPWHRCQRDNLLHGQ